jgi:hypothetical protein
MAFVISCEIQEACDGCRTALRKSARRRRKNVVFDAVTLWQCCWRQSGTPKHRIDWVQVGLQSRHKCWWLAWSTDDPKVCLQLVECCMTPATKGCTIVAASDVPSVYRSWLDLLVDCCLPPATKPISQHYARAVVENSRGASSSHHTRISPLLHFDSHKALMLPSNH